MNEHTATATNPPAINIIAPMIITTMSCSFPQKPLIIVVAIVIILTMRGKPAQLAVEPIFPKIVVSMEFPKIEGLNSEELSKLESALQSKEFSDSLSAQTRRHL